MLNLTQPSFVNKCDLVLFMQILGKYAFLRVVFMQNEGEITYLANLTSVIWPLNRTFCNLRYTVSSEIFHLQIIIKHNFDQVSGQIDHISLLILLFNLKVSGCKYLVITLMKSLCGATCVHFVMRTSSLSKHL